MRCVKTLVYRKIESGIKNIWRIYLEQEIGMTSESANALWQSYNIEDYATYIPMHCHWEIKYWQIPTILNILLSP